jgi:uncharacterized protein
LTKELLIQRLGLEPLPVEGGWFRQTYASPEKLAGGRPASTAILFLLSAPEGFSAIHKLDSDELFHFYLGDPVESLFLCPDGTVEHHVMGADIYGGEKLQLLCPADVWQGHRVMPGGRWSLIGSTMSPGFISRAFMAGEREELCSSYPAAADFITALTREGSALTMPD